MTAQNYYAIIPLFSVIMATIAILVSFFMSKLQKTVNNSIQTNNDLQIEAIKVETKRVSEAVEAIEVDNYKKLRKKISELESNLYANELKTGELHIAWKAHYSKWSAKLGKIERDEKLAQEESIPEGLYPQSEMFNQHPNMEQPPQPQRKPFNLG